VFALVLRFGKLAFGIVPLIIVAIFLLALFLPLANQSYGPNAAQVETLWSATPSLQNIATRLDSSWADHQWDWKSLSDDQGYVDAITRMRSMPM